MLNIRRILMKQFLTLPLAFLFALPTSSYSSSYPFETLASEGHIAQMQLEEVGVDMRGRIYEALDPELAVHLLNWHNSSPLIGDKGFEGSDVDRAYEDLVEAKGEEIIVAVMDSGVDITHDDLQGRLWKNKDEIASNGIDDDNNGYVDDVDGWNFLGGYDENGEAVNIDQDTLEVTREYLRLQKKMTQKRLRYRDRKTFHRASQELSVTVEALEKRLKDNIDYRSNVNSIQDVLRVRYGLYSSYYVRQISWRLNPHEGGRALRKIADHMDKEKILTTMDLLADVEWEIASDTNELQTYYGKEFDPTTISGNNSADFAQTSYGNHDVRGASGRHGTHVAGIIAAVRDNGDNGKKMAEGVASNVLIMPIRVVPDGDERDKDVAMGIRYAVDNGARIINMSFGKGYSPYKKEIDQAFAYAAKNNVLIVHSAGNSWTDIDLKPTYPNADRIRSLRRIRPWLTVGASTYKQKSPNPEDVFDLAVYFTNYGDREVDLFAPGYRIYSTLPDQTYGFLSGTSMAGPVVSGVAALVLSQFPKLTAMELKRTLMRSSRKYPNLDVRLPQGRTPESEVIIPFRKLSRSGGIVNAYRALQYANKHYLGKKVDS